MMSGPELAPLHGKTPPRSALVVVTRRIGDVLLATPLIHSLKRAWPQAALDVLVFEGTEGALAGNADIRHVHTIAARPGFGAHLALAGRLFRRYDIAFSLVPGDRPTFYAFLAGRRSVGLLLDTDKEKWKRRFLDSWVPFDDRDTHTVLMHLALARTVGVTPSCEVIVRWRAEDALEVDRTLAGNEKRIVVLHPYPKFNYKMWHREGWLHVARWLAGHGYRVAITGSGEPAESSYVADLVRDMPADSLNLAGRLALSAVANLISRASAFVGTDTAVTHVAAALGVPTVALFGPTNAVKWGPWPRDHRVGNPWRRCGSQFRGNVALVQGAGACVPCMLEGCDRNIASRSDCLQELPATKVVSALERLLPPST